MKKLAKVIIIISLLFLTGCTHYARNHSAYSYGGGYGVSVNSHIPHYSYPTHDVYVDYGHNNHGYKSHKKHYNNHGYKSHKKHYNKHDYYNGGHNKHERHSKNYRHDNHKPSFYKYDKHSKHDYGNREKHHARKGKRDRHNNGSQKHDRRSRNFFRH